MDYIYETQIEQHVYEALGGLGDEDEQQQQLEDFANKANHMFYVDYPYEKPMEDYLEVIQAYFPAGIVGYEISGEGVKHLQCYCIGTKAKYNAFIGQWKRDYEAKTGVKPTGRANKGVRRNYGKVKHLKKDSKYAIAYCMKDMNYVWWNLDETLIEECKKITYKPEKETDKFQEMVLFAKDIKDLWRDNKIAYLGKLVKQHYSLYKTALSKRTLDKYLLVSGTVTEEQYAQANFGYYAQAYNENNYL